MRAIQALMNGRGQFGLLAAMALAVLVPAIAISAPGDQADLRVTKSDDPDPIGVGDVLTYTIEVENLGPMAATNVVLTDTLPAGVDFVSASAGCTHQGRRVTCEIGGLAASGGQSRQTLTIRVRPRKADTISNTVRVRSAETDPQAANDSDTESTVVSPVPGPPPPPPSPATCRGRTATIVGTNGSNFLIGTPVRDVVQARAGDDTVFTFGGRDLVCAGDGRDFVNGGRRGDGLFGGAKHDRLLGRAGNDGLRGQSGPDVLRGGNGNDDLAGGRGFDFCRGGRGIDLLRGCER
jgi:uncharacterized repeat protein (TIGR01451 family)